MMYSDEGSLDKSVGTRMCFVLFVPTMTRSVFGSRPVLCLLKCLAVPVTDDTVLIKKNTVEKGFGGTYFKCKGISPRHPRT